MRRAAQFRRLRRGTTPRQLGGTGRQVLAELGHGREDRLGHFFEDMECTKLMRHIAEDCGDRLRIKRRAVGGDPLEDQTVRLQGGLEAAEERFDVLVGGVVIEDLVGGSCLFSSRLVFVIFGRSSRFR